MRISSKSLNLAAVVLLTAAVCACEPASDLEGEKPAEPSPARPAEKDVPAPAAVIAPARPPSFADLVEAARPAVVNIYTEKRLPARRRLEFPGGGLVPGQRRAESLGSGFIVADNMILTNWHVVEKATDIEVRLFDERRFAASVVGYDPKTDVALLKVDSDEKLPALEMADSETLRVGDWVVAIGNPLGLTSTVTAGIISATGRKSLPLGGEMMYQDFIQTDASINPGNSGGPLLSVDGRVVGINTAVHAQGQGLGFAIPVNMVREIMPRLKGGGRVERSWLGVYIDPVPAVVRSELGLPKEGGVIVKSVVRGGPAAKGGLKPGDVLLKLGGETVEGPDKLAWIAGNVGVGKEIVLEVQRGDEKLRIPVVMGALPE